MSGRKHRNERSSRNMGRVFSISELCLNICGFLDTPTLAAMVMTNKLLHETTIPILWANLPDLLPLVKTFPEDAWVERRWRIYLTQSLSREDWSSFIKYGRLVRTLGIVAPYRPHRVRLSTSVLPELCALRPDVTLLPKLLSFDWRPLRLPDRHLPMFIATFGTNLHKVRIHFNGLSSDRDRPEALETALKTLSHQSPALQTLELGGVLPFAKALPLSILLQGFHSLTTFMCVTIPISARAITTLGSLPKLHTCAIRIPKGKDVSAIDQRGAQTFRQLKVLSLVGTAAAYVLFSVWTHFPAVVEFEIDVNAAPSADDIPALLWAIPTHVSLQTLGRLVVFTNVTGKPAGRYAQLSEAERRAIVRPPHLNGLLAFRQLRYLNFSPRLVYELNDNLLQSMALVWPLLETCILGVGLGCPHSNAPGSTLKGLTYFAAHCRRLHTIAIFLNASVGLPAHDQDPGGEALYGALWVDGRCKRSTSRVTTLRVQASPIALPRQVARFLSAVFPDLERVEMVSGYDERTPEGRQDLDRRRRKWGEVQQFVSVMRAARLDERRRWESGVGQ